jgi:hypothetical protein
VLNKRLAPFLKLVHPSIVASCTDASYRNLRSICSIGVHLKIGPSFCLHGSGRDKSTRQPAWPNILEGISSSPAENTCARHDDFSPAPKHQKDRLAKNSGLFVQYVRPGVAVTGSLKYCHSVVALRLTASRTSDSPCGFRTRMINL